MVTQRYLDGLGNSPERSLVECNKKKCRALHLGKNNAGHQYVLEADWLQQLSREGSESPGRRQADCETVRSHSKGGQ